MTPTNRRSLGLRAKAAEKPAYKALVDQAIKDNRSNGPVGPELLTRIVDELLVLFGAEILDRKLGLGVCYIACPWIRFEQHAGWHVVFPRAHRLPEDSDLAARFD